MRNIRSISVTFILSIFTLLSSFAKGGIGVAYYDIDNLRDTIPSLFYDDTPFTPDGVMGWNTVRYNHKIEMITAVIDTMQMPIIALFGVENEAVVKDIVAASDGDYCYIHRTRNSFDGIDFALLYYGDIFFPSHVSSGVDYLYVEGEVGHRKIGLFFSCNDRYIGEIIGDIKYERDNIPMLLFGELSTFDEAKHGFINALAGAERAGRGNVLYRNGWSVRDRIVVDSSIDFENSGIFARRYLLSSDEFAPKPTFDRTKWIGGYSRYLPVYTYLR